MDGTIIPPNSDFQILGVSFWEEWEVAQEIIKAPEEANLITNVEGDQKKQEEYQKKIADIETNRMYSWADIE